MILSAYTLSYGNWTVIPDHWKMTFDDMKSNGFDAVDLTFSESEKRYSMRTFEMQVELAHRSGLKVFVIPSRIGGRFAGAPLMPSFWLAEHPQCQVPEDPKIACLESAEYLEWSRGFIEQLVRTFEVDGVIWDEPKAVSLVSHHPETIAKYGPDPTPENMMDSALEYLKDLTTLVKSIRPSLAITVFNMPTLTSTPEYFTSRCPLIPGVDFCGFDGSCSRMSYFHEDPRMFKATVRERWPRICRETAGKCGTFALLENILIPASAHAEFEQELELTLQEVTPDHLACYYWGHNNEDPEFIQKVTMDAIRTVKKDEVL